MLRPCLGKIMIKKRAIVKAKDDSSVTLALKRSSMCDCCAASCKIDCHTFNIKTDSEINIGDEVDIAVDSASFLLGAFMTFMVPSFIFIFVLYLLRDSAWLALGLAFGAIVVYFLIYRKFFLNKVSAKIKHTIVAVHRNEN